LKREGFDITALEPTSDGFSHFAQMRRLILNEARSRGCCPAILDIPAEQLDRADCFDYAFSINVMEHVDDVANVLRSVGGSLKSGASYRFTCPNYLFPYEPHFNIPTLFSKQLTERVLKQKIFSSKRVPDPYGTWKSLNWINVSQIRRHVRRLPGFQITFGRSLLASTLERIISDQAFSARRSPNVRRLLSSVVRLRLHHFLGAIPALLQPIIDCRLKKTIDIRMN
jgi:SAM-dependent methyltransferase